jgi:hypothetical protein
MGHGFCIYAAPMPRRECLVAFVEGFKWLRGATEALVRFDPRFLPVEEQRFLAFKNTVEARIRAGDLTPSEIIPGYWGIANA